MNSESTTSENTATPREKIPWLSVFLVSAAALSYELLLMRLLAIVQWHHFGYMIISLALLGFGASGTLIALGRNWLLPRFEAVYLTAMTLFGLGTVIAFACAQKISFNPEQVLWSLSHLPRLLAIYLLLSLPFLCAAICLGLALTRFSAQIPRLYAIDLLGAGAGSLALVMALQHLHPSVALRLVGVLGIGAAAVACWELGRRAWLGLALSALALCLALPKTWLEPQVSPYKPLSQALEITGTRTVAERSSPLGLVTVVASETVPWRHAPGLSVRADSDIPEQLAVFTDGDAMSVITRFDGRLEPLAYTDQLTSALPYHMASPARVVLLRAGSGEAILQALFQRVPEIIAVELRADLIDLLQGTYREFSGALYELPAVRLHETGARAFAAGHPATVDLIQLPSGSGSQGGFQGISESYDVTVEALTAYLDRLAPEGYLSLNGWVHAPARPGPKLLAAAIEALERTGIADPGAHLVFIRGWQTFTVLVKRTPITGTEINRARDFARDRSFDLAHYPGIEAAEVNRYNVLERPYYYLAAKALLGEGRGEFLARYKYDLRPASDDRPYFDHYFLWNTLGEILALRGRGGVPLLETGYLVLMATLLQAVAAALILILAPLLLLRRAEAGELPAKARKFRILVYFLAVGLGYMLIEIAFMQALTRLLDHPIYSAAVVLTAFLLFSGLGSLWSQRVAAAGGGPEVARRAVAALIGVALITGALFVPIAEHLASASFTLRVGASILALGPLAFCMGMPFPLALSRVGLLSPRLVPWAWGVNGCASVVGPVLALILGLHLGLTAVVGVALGLYATTLWASP